MDKFDLKPLEELERKLKKSYEVKIGIMSKGAEEHGEINNATLGMIHYFGSLSRKIPARDWLKMPVEKAIVDTRSNVADNLNETFVNEESLKSFWAFLGIACENSIRNAFDTGGFGQWIPSQKEEGKTLIDTGQLKNAVESQVQEIR